jgi:hypothetical protein
MQFFEIKLPNAQYHWNVDQDTMGDCGEDGMFISKDKEGYLEITGKKFKLLIYSSGGPIYCKQHCRCIC